MLETIKITPLITYDFALELTHSNMQFYYKKHKIEWENACYAQNWQKSENLGIYQQQRCVGVIRLEQDAHTCYLADLQLLPEVQGQGIGSYVLGYIRQLAQVRQKQLMSLVVFLDNPAINLYRRHGFEIMQRNDILARMECNLTLNTRKT